MKSGIKIDSKKILEVLEKHVDKVVLGIIAILCIVLLWKFVIGSPYSVEQSGRKYSPARVDQNINSLAEKVNEKLDASPETKVYRANISGEFANKMALTVKVDTKNILNLQPGRGELIGVQERVYTKPEVPPLAEAVAKQFRTAVHMPIETVGMETPYEFVQTELADVDLISVQASFDVQALYANFERCFAGRLVHKSEWRDEQLARPLFAAVRLERQHRLADGNWSQWQIVPRGKVDDRRELFQLSEKIGQVELGGIDLLMLNFNTFEMQRGLLQPVTYEFSASNVEWLPPTIHNELNELLEKEARLMEREERGLSSRTSAREDRRSSRDRRLDGEEGRDVYSSRRSTTTRTARLVRTGQRGAAAGRYGGTAAAERTVEDVRQDYTYALISETVDFGEMIHPLLVWAHDDTVQPENTYRYRMRVGVFNPTAGKNWFTGKDDTFKDDVVLWTEYSPVTEPIYIDPMIYLFPVSIARNSGKVTIDVAKFHHGNWHTYEFDVGVGEDIGEPVEMIDEKAELSTSKYAPVVRDEADIIDFFSSSTLVDIAMAPALAAPGAAKPRPYYQIFLTKNGTDISYLPVTKTKWSKQLQVRFGEIKKAQAQEVHVSETRGASRLDYGGMYDSDDEYEDDFDFGEDFDF